jgi:hypothetical protein
LFGNDVDMRRGDKKNVSATPYLGQKVMEEFLSTTW